MNVSKPVFISAILLSVMTTAAAYPFLVNVNVTNLPVDEQGNLRVKTTDEKPLLEHLDFSAKALSLANLTFEPYLSYEFVLLHTSVYPSIDYFTYQHSSSDYVILFNETFIQDTYTQSSYSIQGEVFISVHFVINFPVGDGEAWFRGVASLDKAVTNGTKVNIASWNIAEIGNMDYRNTRHLDYEGVLTRLLPEPVDIAEGDRLCLRLTVEYKSSPSSHFAIYFPKVKIPKIET